MHFCEMKMLTCVPFHLFSSNLDADGSTLYLLHFSENKTDMHIVGHRVGIAKYLYVCDYAVESVLRDFSCDGPRTSLNVEMFKMYTMFLVAFGQTNAF